MGKKVIKFNAARDCSKYLLDVPKPGTHTVPKWYKDQTIYSNGESKTENTMWVDGAHATYKICVPLIDTLTSGYMLTTSAELIVKNIGENEYLPRFFWNVTWPVLDSQIPDVLGNYPTPYAHHPFMFRWQVDWQISTPKEYSLWITHPSHRYDLPFTTLSGFVDTDVFPSNLFLPFFIRDGWEGTIPEGTPIAQLLPVKRDHWKSEKGVVPEGYDFLKDNIIKTRFLRGYKRLFWHRKIYR